MEPTLGKRIAARRKGLALTQDQLAEKLGVTAQAVSKWENDQSCPDIAILPRLSEIFDITTDELLGVPPKKILQAEVMDPEKDPDRPAFEFQFGDEKTKTGPTVGGNFELTFDHSRRAAIGLALWVILTAGLLILSEVKFVGPGNFWSCLWTSGLLVFGLFGLYPKFSALRLGCALLGGYELLSWWIPVPVNQGLWIAFFLLLLGLSILIEALGKKGQHHIHINSRNATNDMTIDGETFRCASTFGEDWHTPQMPKLSQGTAEVSFGDLTVDLSGCEAFSSDCHIGLECAFGQLTLLIPRGVRAECSSRKAFANLDIKGSPVMDAASTICLDCDVSFGQITLRYL